MKLLEIIIYIYLLLRPYYFFSSGTLQLSDIVFLFGFLIFILITAKNKKIIEKSISMNIHYLIFLVFVFFINILYFIYYIDFSFIISSLYYLFNFLIIIVFSYLKTDEDFLKKICVILKINLLAQLLFFFSGIGEYWFGTYRYMGTLNDPNQFAYYVLISYCFILILREKTKTKNILLYTIITLFLIFESSSTGMLLGFVIITIFNSINTIKNIPLYIKKNIKLLFVAILLSSILGIILLDNSNYHNKISNIIINSNIIRRVENKISDNDTNLLQDRGYDMIVKNPHYIIYGAGQGKYDRLTARKGHTGEIHATIPSILFYYGIIPTIFILIWIYKKIKGLPFNIMMIYIALFIESFTLLNQRQALFWIIILLGSTFRGVDNEEV